ncbi:hypothetical protein H4683_001853 [Filibacter limicola]|uniref:Uncharacterized protein n=1 Tax=Sporosarcina limicola TaxID=34101 RepID=A0A927RCV9_9BACL|nr:hypothetical protein [Sporosarcina limicola]
MTKVLEVKVRIYLIKISDMANHHVRKLKKREVLA